MSRNDHGLLMRLALHQEQRRAHGRNVARSVVAIAAVAAATLGTGVAYAFWTTTSTGSGTSTALTLTVTANGAPATTATNVLFPGNIAAAAGTTGGDLVVNVTYTKGPSLKVTSVVQAGPVTVDAAHVAACSSDAGTAPNITALGGSGVYVGTAAPTGFTGTTSYTAYPVPTANQPPVTPNASAQNVTVPFALSMGTGSANGCQGASFTVPVTLTLASS
jgi:hypothetical protein